MELVRKLLLALEEWEPPDGRMSNPEIEGYDEFTIDHHVHLVAEAGLVHAADKGGTMGSSFLGTAAATQLTWHGHEAIAVMRNDTVWSKTKERVAKAGGASLPLWIELATALAKEQLGLK